MAQGATNEELIVLPEHGLVSFPAFHSPPTNQAGGMPPEKSSFKRTILTAIRGDEIPVPTNSTFSVPALKEMLSVVAIWPAELGEKVTEAVQEFPGAKVVQPWDLLNTEGFVISTPVITRSVVPVLDTVHCKVLELPTVTGPKSLIGQLTEIPGD